jgi:predicted DNA binding CopG/RHH family protein
MAKTIQRDARMDSKVVMRATSDDLIQLKKAARLNGTNVATLLRQSLIKLGHLNP